MLRGVLVSIVLLLYILVVGTLFVLYALLTGDADRLYRAGVAGARLGLWLAGVKIEVNGREKIPRDRPCIFMPNHLSNADPPAMVAFLPRVSIMAKKQVFRVPVLGAAMRLVGLIAVDRANPESAREAVEEAVRAIRHGLPFLIFPEGTRSRDGRLLPFKKGAFILAIQAGAPIVPITIQDSERIMRKGNWAMHPGTIHIVVHDPIETTAYTLEQRDQLLARVRAQISSALPEEKRPKVEAEGPSGTASEV